MDTLKLFTDLLVIFYAVDAAVIHCHWTQFRLGALNRESIELLENVGDLMPLKCLEKGERTFPEDAFVKVQNEELAVVAYETLKGVARIFKNNHASVSWSQDKLRLFKNIMSRQVENMQKCVGKNESANNVSANSSIDLIKSYFKELERQLRIKEFSECAWETIRDDVQHCLGKFQTFLEKRNPHYKNHNMGIRSQLQPDYRMASQCLVWITILYIAQVWSMPTSCKLQRRLLATTYNLLETLADPFPLQCFDDKVEITLPTSALFANNSNQDVGVAKVVYNTLTSVDVLFQNEGIPQSWDHQKFDDFQNIVYRQIEESKCVLEKTLEDEEDFRVRDAALAEYFEKLLRHLKNKEFSMCAWEMVRHDTLLILQLILEESSKNELLRE